MEERLFTNWSSEGSPPERTTQCIQSVRGMEPNDITSQREPTEREMGNAREIRHISKNCDDEFKCPRTSKPSGC